MQRPILVRQDVHVPAEAMQVTAVRAGGPGGQNVNKVSSKIELRVDLDGIVGLPEDARARLLAAAQKRLAADGRLLVTSQLTRDRAKNLADAREKVRALIARALVAPRRRKKTRPSRGAVEARLGEKRKRAETKAARRREDRE